MRKLLYRIVLFICLIFLVSPADAATTPSYTIEGHMQAVLNKIASLKVKELQKLSGKKLTLKEKLGFLILKRQLKRGNGDKITGMIGQALFQKKDAVKKEHGKKAEGSSKGQTALVFGIAALVLLVLGLFIPYVIIGSLVASILAIVVGSVAKKQDPSDTKASTGKLLGWITLGLIALLIIAAAIALSGWGL